MLDPLAIPGLFITSPTPAPGKTFVAGAIAYAAAKQKNRIGAMRIIDRNCLNRREGLVSEDAELLAHCGDVRFPLDLICPLRFRGGPPAALKGGNLDYTLAQKAIKLQQNQVDLMIFDGGETLLTAIDPRHTSLDLLKWLKIPSIVVVNPGEDAINQMRLAIHTLKAAHVAVAGVVVNRYDPDHASAADERFITQIEKLANSPLLAVFPIENATAPEPGPTTREAAIRVDWLSIAQKQTSSSSR